MSDTRRILWSELTEFDDMECTGVLLIDNKSKMENAENNNTIPNNKVINEGISKKKIRKKTIVLASFLLVVIVLLVVIIAVLLSKRKKDTIQQKETHAENSTRKISLRDVLSQKFSHDDLHVTWVSDSTYIRKFGKNIYEYDTEDLENPKLLYTRNTSQNHFDIQVESLSPNQEWFLFAKNSRPLYRYSVYGDYYVKHLTTGVIHQIKPPDNDGSNVQVRYCGWSPKENNLVLVYKCNIFFVILRTDGIRYYQITRDGVPKEIFNGVPDWVYEEEILASTHAMEFSSDGRYLSFVTFNATSVPYYKFPRYGIASDQYTYIERIAYPKAGYPNPTIKISVVDLQEVLNHGNSTSRWRLNPPHKFSQTEFYYTTMLWNNNLGVLVQWINRHQNESISVYYPLTDSTGINAEVHQTPDGWIDSYYVRPYFSHTGSYYITLLPKDIGNNKGTYRHVAKISIGIRKGIEFLTNGDFDAQELLCYNSDDEMIYFVSTEKSPRTLHIYQYDMSTKERRCISCGLIKDTDGTECTFYSLKFSVACSWVALSCKGPFAPVSYLVELKTENMILQVDNKKLREMLQSKDLPTFRYYTVESEGYTIPVRETLPHNFDKKKKYPVLFDVYGGPKTQIVNDYHWVDSIFTRLPVFFASHDIIVIQLDARGAGGYGYKFLHSIYRKLGYYETIDALNVAKYLQTQPYVDSDHMAIWGWSYGGFYAANVLAESKGLINTAVSVAPVTDWRYYDTVYSERYMGFPSPSDNLKGYESTSVMSKAAKFAGKNFLLLHGTADDNVHFQNAVQFADSLIKHRIKYSSQFFPDRDHNLYSNGYVYMVIADYLLTHLKGEGLKTGFARYTEKDG